MSWVIIKDQKEQSKPFLPEEKRMIWFVPTSEPETVLLGVFFKEPAMKNLYGTVTVVGPQYPGIGFHIWDTTDYEVKCWMYCDSPKPPSV